MRDSGYQIRTGFVGTPLICDALCSTGHYQAAYRLLLQRECPSWLYPVTMGATTVWERWDSMLPDGTINPGEMTSFNHYALGAVADWMHRTIGGLTPAAPGYRHIGDSPTPRRRTHALPYQPSYSLWIGGMFVEDRGRAVRDQVIVPANTTASVTLPGNDNPLEVGSGSWHWSVPYQDPDARGPYTVDDLVGDIMSDVAARDAMVDVLIQLEVPGFEQMVLFSERNIPLRDGLQKLPNYEQAVTQMNDAFAGSV